MSRAQSMPDAVFLEMVGGATMTYGAVARQAHAWASAFERIGLGRDQQVAVMLPTSFDSVLAWLGAAWVGARQVPVNPAYRGRMLENVLANSQARCLVVSPTFLEQLASIELSNTQVDTVIVTEGPVPSQQPGVRFMGLEQFLSGTVRTDFVGPDYHDIASITYTSGTTGPSKGVLVHWAQLHATSTDGSIDELTSADCFYLPLPLFHIAGQSSIYKMALVGGRVVLRQNFSLSEFFSDIDIYGCTCSVMLESMVTRLMNQPDPSFTTPESLKYVMLVPVPKNVDAFKEKFGLRVGTGYNMTELSMPLSSNGFTVDDSMEGSCGRVRDNYEVRIVDDHDQPVAPGAIGELIVRCGKPWILNGGYFNMPEESVAAWRNGWFHTGDLFTCNERGLFYFVDRKKDSIRRRGENISSSDVEAEVKSHPSVREVAVVSTISDVGEEEVKAFIVLKEGVEADPVGMTYFLIKQMPHFMVPRYLEFVSDFPRTPSLKVQKNLLRAMGNSAATWDREQAGIVVKRSGATP